MKFEIIGPDGINRMTTSQESAMPDAKALADMRRYGFKFKMNGERVSVQKLLEYLQSDKTVETKNVRAIEETVEEVDSTELEVAAIDTNEVVETTETSETVEEVVEAEDETEEVVEETVEEEIEEEIEEAEVEAVETAEEEAEIEEAEEEIEEEAEDKVEAEAAKEAVVEEAVVEEVKEEPSKASSGILCVETGEVFETQSQAAKAYNLHGPQVSNSIKTGKAVKGYTFKKVE